MSSSKPAIVVRDGDEVVDCRRVVLVYQELAHVKAPVWLTKRL